MSPIRPGKMTQLDLEKSLISIFRPHLRIAIVAEGFASLMPMFKWYKIVRNKTGLKKICPV